MTGTHRTVSVLSASAGLLIGLFLSLGPAGCASGTFGHLDRSQEVFDDFMAGKVLPGHRYYTSGVPNTPDAIVGLDETYTLVTERWEAREVTPQILKELVGRMNTEYGSPSAGLHGSLILDDKGGRVGVWYSPIGLTTVSMEGPGTVMIAPPNQVMLQKLQQGSRGSGR